MEQAPVIFSEQQTKNGKKIGVAQLNSAKSLNALNLSMINRLIEKIEYWQTDHNIAVIVLLGDGDKAFCAGGDVVSIYHDMITARENTVDKILSDSVIKNSLAAKFFSKEYQLDLLIHESIKPILVWADGYVMGGGIGLMAGASHRVVTERTSMAMPEVTIGLYPDVGASWFLNQMPKGVGLFLGLTGMTFNGTDAKEIQLADHHVQSNDKLPILAELNIANWQQIEADNHLLLSEILNNYEKAAKKPDSNIIQHLSVIEKITSANHIEAIYSNIINEKIDSSWFNQAQQKIKHGSPLSLHLIYRQLKSCEGLSLQACFQSELNLSLRCCQQTEFSEGVRALLVDKDRKPQWQYSQINEVDLKEIDWFFSPVN